MQALEAALQETPFFVVAVVCGLLFGYGGTVHLANMLGRGEFAWSKVATRFKFADVVWGLLDFGALIGVLLRSPWGVLCLLLAALSQIVAYGLFPAAFATKPEHLPVLRGMVMFHVCVLAALAIAFFVVA